MQEKGRDLQESVSEGLFLCIMILVISKIGLM